MSPGTDCQYTLQKTEVVLLYSLKFDPMTVVTNLNFAVTPPRGLLWDDPKCIHFFSTVTLTYFNSHKYRSTFFHPMCK